METEHLPTDGTDVGELLRGLPVCWLRCGRSQSGSVGFLSPELGLPFLGGGLEQHLLELWEVEEDLALAYAITAFSDARNIELTLATIFR